ARAQLVLQLLVHGILPLGAVERDGGDAVGHVEQDRLLLCHGAHCSPRAACARRRSAPFSARPDAASGRSASAVAHTYRGTLERASVSRQNACSSVAVGFAPGRGTTKAATFSPRVGWGTPTTCADLTVG